MDPASPYALKPWLGQYGSTIPATLATPEFTSVAAMAAQAMQRHATRTAFTTVMPNGMYGSLSYAQLDEMSDAFAL